MAEASTAVIIAQTIGIAVGTVAAIGIIAYGIYRVKKYMTEDPHSHKEKREDGENLASSVDYESIKPKTQDTTVRQRNVKKEKDIQTGTSVPGDFCLPIYENRALSDDNASVSSSTTFGGTLSTFDSLASTETVTPDIDQDVLGARIPTWSEMSDADRALCLCPSCEKEVSTITIPCEHPYLCDECAPTMLKFYSGCPLCRKHITSYQSI